MKASVVVTVKNEGKNLPGLLDVLIRDQDIEIIIVDSESTDNTEEIVNGYAKKHKGIKLIRKRSTRGMGRNIGVENSSSELILFTDGDAIPHEGWVECMISCLSDHDLVAGESRSLEGKGTSAMPRVKLYRNGFEITLPSMNLGIRKSLFDSLGGFDESFVTAEDIDLNLRAVVNGARFMECRECIVYHRSRGGFSGLATQAFWNGYGRRQLRHKNIGIWKTIEKGKTGAGDISFQWFLRNAFGVAGYVYCMFNEL